MPVSSVAISVEGVLRHSFSSSPIPTGIALYHSLKSNFNIVLYSEQDRKTLDYWLGIEALNIHAAVEYNEDVRKFLADGDRKLTQLQSLRKRGFSIEVVVEPDPNASAWMINNGFNVLTFTHAKYARPQWRPDFEGKPRPWEDLEHAAVKNAELRALDARLKAADEENEWH